MLPIYTGLESLINDKFWELYQFQNSPNVNKNLTNVYKYIRVAEDKLMANL